MFIYEDIVGTNEQGNMTIGGCDTVELAKKYGTPLYVMDENAIRKACRSFKHSIDNYYHGNGLVLFASKAFSCKEIYRIINEEECGVDVVSGGELYTALSVDIPAEKIMLRIKPGIDAHTHDFIKTGQIDSKFGFALETGEAFEAVKKSINYKNIEFTGIHCHIGSQIFDTAPFEAAADVMYSFAEMVKLELGFEIKEINLGGGFGIKYTGRDNPTDLDRYMSHVAKVHKQKSEQFGMYMPRIFIEPGRSIVGPAGLTLYTVGDVKTIPDIRTYVAVDGSMCDNPRYALYQAAYDVYIANKATQPRDFVATIAGRCCESGDLIQENTKIQTPEVGDIAAVLATGAYNYSMSCNYNRLPKPAVVFVKDGQSRIVVKRETYEDIIRNDI